jgi:5-methylcytosine-specific restriction endonuclease McrA
VRPARLPIPVVRAMAGTHRYAARSVHRPTRPTASLRPPAPPSGPSRRDVLRRWEELELWLCTYCDTPFGETVALEMDHVRPLAKGGAHDGLNLVPACSTCNRSKGDKDVGVWLTETAGESFTC